MLKFKHTLILSFVLAATLHSMSQAPYNPLRLNSPGTLFDEMGKVGMGAEMAFIKSYAESHFINALSFQQTYISYVTCKDVAVHVVSEAPLGAIYPVPPSPKPVHYDYPRYGVSAPGDTILYYHDCRDSLAWAGQVNIFMRTEMIGYENLYTQYTPFVSQFLSSMALRQTAWIYRVLERRLIKGSTDTWADRGTAFHRTFFNLLGRLGPIKRSLQYISTINPPKPPINYKVLLQDKNGDALAPNTQVVATFEIYDNPTSDLTYTSMHLVYQELDNEVTNLYGQITQAVGGQAAFDKYFKEHPGTGNGFWPGQAFLEVNVAPASDPCSPIYSETIPLSNLYTNSAITSIAEQIKKGNLKIDTTQIKDKEVVSSLNQNMNKILYEKPLLPIIQSDDFDKLDDTQKAKMLLSATGNSTATGPSWGPTDPSSLPTDLYSIASGIATTITQYNQSRVQSLTTFLQNVELTPISTLLSGGAGQNSQNQQSAQSAALGGAGPSGGPPSGGPPSHH